MRYILSIFLIFAIFGFSVTDELRQKKIKLLSQSIKNALAQRELKQRMLQEAEETSTPSNSTEPERDTKVDEDPKEVNPDSPVSSQGITTGNSDANIQIIKFFNFKVTSTNTFNLKVNFFYLNRLIANIVRFRLRVTSNSRRNRNLNGDQTAESCPTTCTLVDPKLADTMGDGKKVDYNCEGKTDKIDPAKANVSLNTDVKMELEDKAGNKQPFDFKDVNFKGNSAEEASNLQEVENLPDTTVDLNNVKFVTSDKDSFTLKGIADPKDLMKEDDIIPLKIQNKQTDGPMLTEEVQCKVQSIDKSSGETVLKCTGDANTDMKTIHSLTTSNDKKDYTLNIYVENWNDPALPTIQTGKYYQGTPTNNMFYRKSSSGLSGGAIAGIVIACVVVLAAASIAAIMLRKPAPPIYNTTVVGLKTVDNI